MIDGDRVKQARELHGMTQTRLIDDVPDLTQSRLSRIEKGTAVLREDDLIAATIAAATGVTVDWLIKRRTPGFSGLSPHFRARSRTTQTTKDAGLAWAALVNEAHVVLADRVRAMPLKLEPMVGADPRRAAQVIRQRLGFDSLQPLPYLVLAVERIGVRVLGLPWKAPTVDAFCAWTSGVPTIALTSDVPGDRRRWTTAHELAHLVLHDDTRYGKDVETEADAFAAELLTPLDGLRLQMPRHPTLQALTMLKSQWGVSVKSLVRRARELGVVDDDRATGLYRQISARGWNKAEPGYVPLEKPRALRKMVEIAVGARGADGLAAEMGWSAELAHLVLAQHAREDELPMADYAPAASHLNVLPLRRREA